MLRHAVILPFIRVRLLALSAIQRFVTERIPWVLKNSVIIVPSVDRP